MLKRQRRIKGNSSTKIRFDQAAHNNNKDKDESQVERMKNKEGSEATEERRGCI